MKSIRETVQTEIIIQKSRFINYLIPVQSVKEAMKQLSQIKQNHPTATHHCYAYIIGQSAQLQKYDDDGEPSRTAGLPMLDVLIKQDITDIIAITIRYFGGIKLGASGLVRAYSSSVSKSLKIAIPAILARFMIVKLLIPFSEIGHVEHFIRSNYKLIETKYTEYVEYLVEIEESNYTAFTSSITERTRGLSIVNVVATKDRYI